MEAVDVLVNELVRKKSEVIRHYLFIYHNTLYSGRLILDKRVVLRPVALYS